MTDTRDETQVEARTERLRQERDDLRATVEALHAALGTDTGTPHGPGLVEAATKLRADADKVQGLEELVQELEHDARGYGELMLLLGDALGMDAVTGVALVERVRRLVGEQGAADRERNEAAFRMEFAESRLAAIRQRAGEQGLLEQQAWNAAYSQDLTETLAQKVPRTVEAVARYILGDGISETVEGVSNFPSNSEPTTAEAFADINEAIEAVRDDKYPRIIADARAAVALLKRRMEAMAAAMRMAMTALDALLGDSDLPQDDRPGVLAMRALQAAITGASPVFTLEEIERAVRTAGVGPATARVVRQDLEGRKS